MLNTDDSGAGSLRQAISDAVTGDTIAFQPGLTGTIRLSDTVTIDKGLTISGPGRDRLTVSGEGAVRQFYVTPGVGVSLSGLTMSDGYAEDRPGFSPGGGSIYNNGSLTVSGCAFTDNTFASSIGGSGGAIYSFGGGPLTVSDCTFSGNLVTTIGSGANVVSGGAISCSSLTVSDCMFSNNFALSDSGYGGAIRAFSLLVTNSTFTGNLATWGGGAIYSPGANSLTVSGCTFSGNSAGIYGGAILQSSGGGTGSLTATNCTFTENGWHDEGTIRGYYFEGASTYYGAAILSTAVTTLTNCTIAGNLTDGNAISTYLPGPQWDGTLRISNTIVANTLSTEGPIPPPTFTVGARSCHWATTWSAVPTAPPAGWRPTCSARTPARSTRSSARS